MAAGNDSMLEAQLAQLNSDFDAADTDKSGSLTMEEVLGVLKLAGFIGTQADANAIFSSADGGKVTKEEFNAGFGRLSCTSRREMALRRDFALIDTDKSGTLSKKEISNALYSDNTSPTLKEAAEKAIEYTFSYMDDDGKVSYDEFLRILNFDQSESELFKAFEVMDKDGSGDLSVEEMQEAVKTNPELARMRPQIERVLYEYSVDFYGRKINFHRFVMHWMKQRDAIRAEDTSSNSYM